MSLIYIDGEKFLVNSKKNLLQNCLSLGFDIPYFCWHPELGSIGACRQCAIKKFKDRKDKNGLIVMSCMTPSLNESYISINNEEVKLFRKCITELLMINHPHDCPVCEEGGQCHLQDMIVMNKHHYRRYRFKKRTHINQNLGPFISHEMNRCISCYRCVRYYKDYSDGKDFGVYGSRDNIYFGRYKSGMLENKFSGNLIEICPTGVFTDKIASKKYTRKWDMQFAPSVCQHCSIGCNIVIGERYGELKKIENRYNSNINHYFICDLGRFGYEYTNLKNRFFNPLKKTNNKWKLIDNVENSVKKTAKLLKKSKKIIGIGSPRASLESNFALLNLVGKENFSIGMLAFEKACIKLIIKIIKNGGIHVPTLREIEKHDAILILGEDLTQTSARAALSVRQAVKNKINDIVEEEKLSDNWHAYAIINHGQKQKYPLFITSVDKTDLDEISVWNYYASVSDQARLGFAIANEIDQESPKVLHLSSKLQNKAKMIAKELLLSKKPLIISGTHLGNISLIEAAANIAKALKNKNKNVGISLFPDYSNSIGLNIIGGHSLESILKLIVNSQENNTLIILENDLYRRLSKKNIKLILKKTFKLILIDHIITKTTNHADLFFPATNFSESCGTLINQEGRAQRFFQSYDCSWYKKDSKVLNSWSWLYAIYSYMKHTIINWINLDNIIELIIKTIPEFKFIQNIAPNAKFRISGQKIARSPNRYSGRTSMLSNIDIHEARQQQDLHSMFSYSMEGINNSEMINNQYIPFSWVPGWNSVQSLHKYQKKIDDNYSSDKLKTHFFKTNKNKKMKWFSNIPIQFNKEINCKLYLVVPYYHLFGSEEMTQLSPTIKKLIPNPYIVMNHLDALNIGIKNDNKIINFNILEENYSLPVRFSKYLQEGQIGLPIGLPNIPIYLFNTKIYLENQGLHE